MSLKTGDIARALNCSSQTVINWLNEGRIPFARVGTGPRLVLERDFCDYLEKMNLLEYLRIESPDMYKVVVSSRFQDVHRNFAQNLAETLVVKFGIDRDQVISAVLDTIKSTEVSIISK